MKIGKLNMDPDQVYVLTEGSKRNPGKYTVTAKGELAEKATGKVDPEDYIGVPFPPKDLDPKDPLFSYKVFYNQMAILQSMGSHKMTAELLFLGEKYERKIYGPQKAVKFHALETNIKNQWMADTFGKGIDEIFVMRVTDPYELNGLATMTYSYIGATPDKVFAYVPALRRARVLTAAARSDSMFGTDYALDDAGCGWWGKPMNFNFKYIKTQETLSQFATPDRILFRPNPDGTIDMDKNFTSGKWGFQTPGWKGKPWAITNSTWVKRKAYVIEVTAKDPYYNYGKMELWMDAGTNRPIFKIINDRAGKRWKVMIMNNNSLASSDQNYPYGLPNCASGDAIYDEQRNHATGCYEYAPGFVKHFNQKWDTSEFTLGGLSKISK